jgi:plasmid stabilization system protein ParE
MSKVIRSALFKRQLIEIVTGYRVRAGSAVALKFVDQIEAGIRFIAEKPYACVVYTRTDGREFRKWSIRGFPVSMFFRFENEKTIVLEALYMHRMNFAARFSDVVE